jgi:hypothetical protein
MTGERRLTMSDRYPAEIHIGGAIPRKLLDKLVRKIRETGASLNGYDDGCATEDEVRVALSKGTVLDLCDCHAGYGHFQELEKFLIRHQIHFNHHCEACYEYDAENNYYRGSKVLTMAANQVGDCLLPVGEVLNILDDSNLDDHAKIDQLRKLSGPPKTTPLQPIRFI